MRIAWLFLTCALALASPARADSLWDAEVRLGYGVTTGETAAGKMATRRSPMSVAALAGWAISDDPPLMGYAGLGVETLDRTSVGAQAGVKLAVAGPVRVTAGGTWIFAPYTLWGAVGSVGACSRVARTFKACGDLQLTAYFAGDDLIDKKAVTQIQLAIGLVFDAP